MAKEKKTADRRMVGKYTIAENGCHLWMGATNADGYGILSGETHCNTPMYAHRAAWEAVNGPKPMGLAPDETKYELHHTCHNSLCVNEEHLRLLSHLEHRREHRRTAPKVPLKQVPCPEVLTWTGLLWHRIERACGNGPRWAWSVEL
jgi:hypothetical protein